MYEAICAELEAAPVQHIGKLLVIWRSGSVRLRENRAAEDDRPFPVSRKGAAPKTVMVRKVTRGTTVRKPKPSKLKVLGNERVTAGGTVKRARARPVSQKKKALD
jgi:hypothetical protein